jgi:hypothetical protein
MKRIIQLLWLLLPVSAFALSDSQLAIDCGKQYKITAAPIEGYRFVRWSDGETDNPRVLTALDNMTFSAVFEKIQSDTTHVTGDVNIDDVTDPNVIVEPGGNLNINASGISIGALIITSDGIQSGQVHHGGHTICTDNVYLEYILNPWGTIADPNRWYAFAVPFEVEINGGVSRTCDNKALVSGTDFLIMKYNGFLRALQGKGWTKMESNETLVPGQFYMLGIDGTCNRWRFKKKAGQPYEGNAHNILSAFESVLSAADAGWNSLGNTLLEYAGLTNMSLSGINYMVTYDNQYGKYVTKLISEMTDLFVGQPFFIQTTGDGSFDFHHNTSSHMPALYAQTQTTTPLMHFMLADEAQSTGIDHMYVTLHEDAVGTYTIGRDVARMTTDCKTAAQVWCISAEGTQLSAHGIATPETATIVPLGIYAPKAGEYLFNLSADAIDEYDVELLYQDAFVATFYPEQPISLDLNAGTTNDYSLRIRRKMKTDLPTTGANDDKGEWYDILGRKVQSGEHGIFIRRGEKVIK